MITIALLILSWVLMLLIAVIVHGRRMKRKTRELDEVLFGRDEI
jgi:hypothetical protein